jgi:transcriptional regulator with XRE-family HTH domain
MPSQTGETASAPEQVFGRVLQQLRRERGLSQERLAEESGCHRTYISLLERGRYSPSLTMLFQLASALNVTPSLLLTRVEAALKQQAEPGGTDGS